MIYKVVDLQTVQDTGSLYVLVHFWDDTAIGKPNLINDFFMQVPDTQTRLVIDGNGDAKTDSGVVVTPGSGFVEDPDDPLVRETVPFDAPQRIKENIEAYWDRAQGRGDQGNKSLLVPPALTSGGGVLDRADVQALKGSEVTPSQL